MSALAYEILRHDALDVRHRYCAKCIRTLLNFSILFIKAIRLNNLMAIMSLYTLCSFLFDYGSLCNERKYIVCITHFKKRL